MEDRLDKGPRIQWKQNDENETKKPEKCKMINDRASVAIL